MAPLSSRKSPSLFEQQNGSASTSLRGFAFATADIPSTSDLNQLVSLLRHRKSLILRKRKSLKDDEQNILQSQVPHQEASGNTLASILDGNDEQEIASRASVSPLSTALSLAPPTPGKPRTGLVKSPSPRTNQPSASPAPSGIGPSHAAGSSSSQQSTSTVNRTKVKVKRDPDREGSESLAAAGAPQSTGAADNSLAEGTSGRQDSEARQSIEPDWDEEGPSRPVRAYQHKRKRQYMSMSRDLDDLSQSELDSPQPSVTLPTSSPQRNTFFNGRPTTTASSSTIKLKLNPTTHTAPMRTDSFGSSIRRPSMLRGREDFGGPMTPMQASQAAMWELPKRTPETFIPKPPVSKPIRTFPIRPDEVDVDFAKMDWKERDRERDRLEAAAAQLSGGPGPGQAVVKEGNAASRSRDRKQDQVAHHTFQQWADGWFRTLTEEDLAWFSSKPDELDSFQIPPLGRHYSEVWEEEEANGVLVPTTYMSAGSALPSSVSGSTQATPAFAGVNGVAGGADAHTTKGVSNASHSSGVAAKFDPRNLKDDHLYGGSLEDARGGPFTERLLAALLPTMHPPPSPVSNSNAVAESAPPAEANGLTIRPSTNGISISAPSGPSAPAHSQDMAEFEERLRRELKAIDVIGDEDINWSERADDEISSTLRKVQRLLRKQLRINEMRKIRLFQIALDRMAYQDYLGCLNSVEREIESGWLKRQSQIKKSMQAQKKKKGGSSGNANGSAPNPTVNGLASAASDGQGANSPAHRASTPGAAAMAASSSSLGHPSASDRGGGPIPPQFSEALLSAMDKRKQLKFAFEPLFANKPLAKYTPKGDESIFADLES